MAWLGCELGRRGQSSILGSTKQGIWSRWLTKGETYTTVKGNIWRWYIDVEFLKHFNMYYCMWPSYKICVIFPHFVFQKMQMQITYVAYLKLYRLETVKAIVGKSASHSEVWLLFIYQKGVCSVPSIPAALFAMLTECLWSRQTKHLTFWILHSPSILSELLSMTLIHEVKGDHVPRSNKMFMEEDVLQL